MEVKIKKPRNNNGMNKLSLGEHLQLLYRFFLERGEKYPKTQLPMKKLNYHSFSNKGDKGIQSVWLNHSSLLLKIDGYTLLTDPIFERRISPVGPTMYHGRKVLDIEEISHIDAVIISHDHYDHLNKFSIQKLIPKTTLFIVPMMVGDHLRKWGVPQEKIIELKWWDEFYLTEDLLFVATPAQHFSGRGLRDRNRTLWASWVIKGSKHSIFFSGDSGYFDGFKAIGEKYGPFDVTYLECGAYNERWSSVHMFPEETIKAHIDLGGKRLQPIHWGSFNLALHPWYEPVERLLSEAWKKDVQLLLPVMGEVVNVTVQGQPDLSLWWEQAKEDVLPMRSMPTEKSLVIEER